MSGSGEEQNETIRPEFDRCIMIDFQGAKITSDTGFLLLREIDERFGILGPVGSELEDTRSWVHSKHTLLQMVSSVPSWRSPSSCCVVQWWYARNV